MKSIYLSILFFLCSFSVAVAQTTPNKGSEELIRKGAEMHDKGKYQEAISFYEHALELNPSSMSAIYEMSLSYLHLKDYAKALKYSSKVIESNFKPLLVDAYAVKGTVLADTEKMDLAVATFKDALKRCGDEYLLHFNLGLCYFNQKENEKAVEHLARAIEIDATHSSAFLLYAYALNDTGRWVQSFYAFHFFLLLEPNTDRSKDAFDEMFDILMRDYEPNAPELTIVEGLDRSVLYDAIVEKRPEADLEEDSEAQYQFYEDASRIIFFTLSQLQDDAKSSLVWYFFVPTYQEILNSGYFETYCKYVSVASFEESLEWWSSHQDEVDHFIAWFEHGADGGDTE